MYSFIQMLTFMTLVIHGDMASLKRLSRAAGSSSGPAAVWMLMELSILVTSVTWRV